MARSIELQQERAGVVAQARSLLERSESEKRDLTAEEQTQWTALMDQRSSLEERIKRAKWAEENPAEGDEDRFVWDKNHDAQTDPKNEADDLVKRSRSYRSAFHAYLRSGEAIPIEDRTALLGPKIWTDKETRQLVERRVQEVQALPTGGFWVPDEMMQRVEKAMLFFGGMREAVGVAGTITTDTGADLPWPVYDDTANTGRRLAESAAVTTTDVTVSVRTMKAFMYSSDRILMSYQLLQDAPLMSENLIADALGERIGRITNTEFTTYAGGDGPQGLIRGSTLGVTAAATGAITSDELHNLQYAVNRAYRNERSAYMMADATLRTILQLKDGEGRYLFMPDPRAGGEPLIHGRRVVVNNDMPALATTNITVEFGDFSHYKIRDVRGFTLLRLNELYAANLQVGFIGFSRHDGQYINAGQNPIQHLIQA